MTPLQIGLIVFLVILIIVVIGVVLLMSRKSASSAALPPSAVDPYGAPVSGAAPYIPPQSSGAPPQPIWNDPSPPPVQAPMYSPPLPTGTQYTLPPPPPPVYVAPAPAPARAMPLEKPTLFREPRYGGDAWQVPGLGKYAVANSRVRNEASSMRVPTGWRLTVYDKDDCTGNSASYISDIDDLAGTGLNNDIACVDLQLA